MVKTLKIKQTESSPEVIFNQKKNIFKIRGRSIQENPIPFYDTIYEWFKKYSISPNPKTDLVVDMDYINSTSTRKIVKLFKQLEDLQKDNFEITIVWMYQNEDVMMFKKGKEFQKTFKINFEIKSH